MGGHMNKTIHATWAQGENNLPAKFRENLDMWQAAMPGWTLHIWDTVQACERWEDFSSIERKCYHHATRSDLIQARVMRDIGGIYIGTDSTPAAGLPRFLNLIESVRESIVVDLKGAAAMNCLAFSRGGGSKFWSCVVNHQMRDNCARLGDRNVHHATGPGCMWGALKAHQWGVHMIPMMEAYTHHWNGSYPKNPDAYCNPGYAASWQKPHQ
jgi:mannosyltransferase OCH1-like enzyme